MGYGKNDPERGDSFSSIGERRLGFLLIKGG